jgi:transcriptional regulator with XRE-family HTH domain
MKSQNVNTTELAARMGYSIQHVSDLLLGQRRWNETSIDRACEALGLHIEFVSSLKNTGTEY